VYHVLPVNRLLGGHYAVQRPDGTLFGEDLRLDRDKATVICSELNRALREETQVPDQRGIISR
jgi:hypothetical protein